MTVVRNSVGSWNVVSGDTECKAGYALRQDDADVIIKMQSFKDE
jgi:hypothetical protein